MATLKDVAKLANVDISTVSRALNNVSYVHPETKKRIFDAVEKLSYHPNVLAKGLREGKHRTIAIVVPRFANAIYSDMIPAITEHARRKNYECVICTTYEDEDIERDILKRLRSGLVDGIIISSTGKNIRLLKDINAEGISVLQAIRKQDDSLSSIISDYYATGYDAVKFLVKKGCRNIGLIIGNLAIHPYSERFNGYAKAMREAGLETIVAMDDEDPHTFEYGRKCTFKLLDEHPELDAVLASVDIQGIGALRALKERGKRVPDDIKLISLTGISLGKYLETTMTSMEVPASEIGEEAANLIIKDIELKGEHRAVKKLVFNATLEEREST